jgi:hypothetical protein
MHCPHYYDQSHRSQFSYQTDGGVGIPCGNPHNPHAHHSAKPLDQSALIIAINRLAVALETFNARAK